MEWAGAFLEESIRMERTMDCWGVMGKEFRSRGHAEQGMSKCHVAIGADKESANENQYRVFKAARLPD